MSYSTCLWVVLIKLIKQSLVQALDIHLGDGLPMRLVNAVRNLSRGQCQATPRLVVFAEAGKHVPRPSHYCVLGLPWKLQRWQSCHLRQYIICQVFYVAFVLRPSNVCCDFQ